MAKRREMDETVLSRAAIIAVDSIEQIRGEAGDLIQGLSAANRSWDDVVELKDVVSGGKLRRESPDDITIFKSCGIAIWDVVAAGFIYGEALQRKKGSPFVIWQDLPL